ncbi:MAG: hypothetical protein IPP96_06735 [Chitinophagaceae bacterium]|nr:hypothetical protein [Chitinophagaceae bacterium]
MKKIYFVLSFLCLSAVLSTVNAQLLQWNTFGNAGTETTEPSVFNNANISAANLTQGTITAAANAASGGSGWFNTVKQLDSKIMVKQLQEMIIFNLLLRQMAGFHLLQQLLFLPGIGLQQVHKM